MSVLASDLSLWAFDSASKIFILLELTIVIVSIYSAKYFVKYI